MKLYNPETSKCCLDGFLHKRLISNDYFDSFISLIQLVKATVLHIDPLI